MRDSLKIAVASQDIIVRMGVVAALRRALGSDVAYLEIVNPEDYETRIVSFAPTVVVVSPHFGGRFDLDGCRSAACKVVKGVKFVALVSSVLPSTAIVGFDGILSIFDTEDDIRLLFEQLRGKIDEVENAPEADDETLSVREKEIVRGVVSGLANKEIADRLNISVYTVLTHRRNISRKLNIHSSIALAIYAISNKIVNVDEVKE